jgi:hypothetical protein
MKNERRSQLDKFQSKLAKVAQDNEALKRAELERKQKLLDRVNGIMNADKLQAQGGIEEAALVVSYAGMESLSSMLVNSFRAMLKEELPEIVRSVYREERANEMKGQLLGVQNRLEDEIRSIMDELHSEEEIVAQIEAESVTVHVEEKIITPVRKDRRGGRTRGGDLQQEAKMIAEKLRSYNGNPIKIGELAEMFPEINFGQSVSGKLSRMKRMDDRIISIGKGSIAYRMEE